MLLCATLIETMVIHQLYHSGYVVIALVGDKVCRWFVTLFLFPGMVL
jgi:hypothetical protein